MVLQDEHLLNASPIYFILLCKSFHTSKSSNKSIHWWPWQFVMSLTWWNQQPKKGCNEAFFGSLYNFNARSLKPSCKYERFKGVRHQPKSRNSPRSPMGHQHSEKTLQREAGLIYVFIYLLTTLVMVTSDKATNPDCYKYTNNWLLSSNLNHKHFLLLPCYQGW